MDGGYWDGRRARDQQLVTPAHVADEWADTGYDARFRPRALALAPPLPHPLWRIHCGPDGRLMEA